MARRSLPFYACLLAAGALPAADPSLFGGDASSLAVVRIVYFGSVAVATVYLGAERQDVGAVQAPVTGDGAKTAPFFAAATLGLLYAIIKYTDLDPGSLYRVFTSVFGLICLTEVLQPLVALSPLPGLLLSSQDEEETPTFKEKGKKQPQPVGGGPPAAVGESEADAASFRAAALPAAALSLVIVASYLSAVSDPAFAADVHSLRDVAWSNNYVAGAIALATLGQISLDSFVTGAVLLAGLCVYDAASVFASDAMVTVATSIEAPVKLLFAGTAPPPPGRYPFAVLGLGDILAPGVFIGMLRQFDVERWCAGRDTSGPPARPTESLDPYAGAETPYFFAAMAAYVASLGVTFGVVFVTGKGQPALFYIVPALLAASLGTAAFRGEIEELVAFKGARAGAAKEARQAWKDARAEQKRKDDAEK